jgi:hypothetical protein
MKYTVGSAVFEQLLAEKNAAGRTKKKEKSSRF